MYFLIIQLFKTEYKDDLLLALKTCGINSGCTFEGENLENALEHDYPLFKGLIHAAHERERHCLLITTIVEDHGTVNNLTSLLADADINIKNDTILRIVLLPAHRLIDSTTDWEFTA
ncbi:hypothetical protein JXO52_12645 [bacterium]|nr:hypothetical protein [bacterium]